MWDTTAFYLRPLSQREAELAGRVPLDKEKGFVKDEDILSGAEHRFFGHQKRLGACTPGYHR
jgi:hypothetical protein